MVKPVTKQYHSNNEPRMHFCLVTVCYIHNINDGNLFFRPESLSRLDFMESSMLVVSFSLSLSAAQNREVDKKYTLNWTKRHTLRRVVNKKSDGRSRESSFSCFALQSTSLSNTYTPTHTKPRYQCLLFRLQLPKWNVSRQRDQL